MAIPFTNSSIDPVIKRYSARKRPLSPGRLGALIIVIAVAFIFISQSGTPSKNKDARALDKPVAAETTSESFDHDHCIRVDSRYGGDLTVSCTSNGDTIDYEYFATKEQVQNTVAQYSLTADATNPSLYVRTGTSDGNFRVMTANLDTLTVTNMSSADHATDEMLQWLDSASTEKK